MFWNSMKRRDHIKIRDFEIEEKHAQFIGIPSILKTNLEKKGHGMKIKVSTLTKLVFKNSFERR